MYFIIFGFMQSFSTKVSLQQRYFLNMTMRSIFDTSWSDLRQVCHKWLLLSWIYDSKRYQVGKEDNFRICLHIISTYPLIQYLKCRVISAKFHCCYNLKNVLVILLCSIELHQGKLRKEVPLSNWKNFNGLTWRDVITFAI